MSAQPIRPVAYQRALGRLARMHQDEMADLYASERIRLGLPLETQKARHGTLSKSRYGCSCARCRSAARITQRDRNQRGLPEGDHRHGTVTGYTNHGCRCDGCREARREYARKRREATA